MQTLVQMRVRVRVQVQVQVQVLALALEQVKERNSRPMGLVLA